MTDALAATGHPLPADLPDYLSDAPLLPKVWQSITESDAWDRTLAGKADGFDGYDDYDFEFVAARVMDALSESGLFPGFTFDAVLDGDGLIDGYSIGLFGDADRLAVTRRVGLRQCTEDRESTGIAGIIAIGLAVAYEYEQAAASLPGRALQFPPDALAGVRRDHATWQAEALRLVAAEVNGGATPEEWAEHNEAAAGLLNRVMAILDGTP